MGSGEVGRGRSPTRRREGRSPETCLPACLPRPRSPLFRPGLVTLHSPPPPGDWLAPFPQVGDLWPYLPLSAGSTLSAEASKITREGSWFWVSPKDPRTLPTPNYFASHSAP